MSQPAAAGAPAPPPRAAGSTAYGIPAPAAPPAPAPGPTLPTGMPLPAPQPGAAVRGGADTPTLMRRISLLVATICTVFAVVGGLTLVDNRTALGRAGTNVAQVVTVQSVYADLLRADADATNAFLVGGLENADQRADYEAAMGRVSESIAAASAAQPADATALAALNGLVTDYAATIESARAYNREGLPVGAQYLKIASTTLRGQALPILDNLIAANRDRVDGEIADAGSSWPLIVSGIAALASVVWAGVWLAGRTRRRLNVGVLAAAGAVLIALVAATGVAVSAASSAKQARDNRVQGALTLTTIRSAAYDAKANESLGLIARGQAAPYEAQVKARQAQVKSGMDTLSRLTWPAGADSVNTVNQPWEAYVAAHTAVRALDDKGAWDDAVKAVTDAKGATATSFTAFDEASAAALKQFDQSLQQEIAAPQWQLALAALVTVLLGLGAATATRRGFAARTKEYE
ncbi:MAG TPA: hypothetical protein PKA99_15075 [Dermatophilaceae bacterium]|nr:hypothetical protein [Dermatophilaceae bacterium]